MATKNYMINDKWLDLDKQNIVELQSVDGELDSLKVNGSEIVTPSGKITITENGTDIDVAQYATADVNVEGGGGGDYFVELQTINIPARSVTGVYDSELELYIALEEIADVNAAVLAEYSYDEDFTYNKFIKVDNAVNTYAAGVTLDSTGFPEDILSASLILDNDKWTVDIESENAFTVTLNPQTAIVYRATEDVANYFRDAYVLLTT